MPVILNSICHPSSRRLGRTRNAFLQLLLEPVAPELAAGVVRHFEMPSSFGLQLSGERTSISGISPYQLELRQLVLSGRAQEHPSTRPIGQVGSMHADEPDEARHVHQQVALAAIGMYGPIAATHWLTHAVRAGCLTVEDGGGPNSTTEPLVRIAECSADPPAPEQRVDGPPCQPC